MNQTDQGSRAYLISIVMVAVIGGLLFGYDTAVISGAAKGFRHFLWVPMILSTQISGMDLQVRVLSWDVLSVPQFQGFLPPTGDASARLYLRE